MPTGLVGVQGGVVTVKTADGGLYQTAKAAKSRTDPQEVVLTLFPPVGGVRVVTLDLTSGTTAGLALPTH